MIKLSFIRKQIILAKLAADPGWEAAADEPGAFIQRQVKKKKEPKVTFKDGKRVVEELEEEDPEYKKLTPAQVAEGRKKVGLVESERKARERHRASPGWKAARGSIFAHFGPGGQNLLPFMGRKKAKYHGKEGKPIAEGVIAKHKRKTPVAESMAKARKVEFEKKWEKDAPRRKAQNTAGWEAARKHSGQTVRRGKVLAQGVVNKMRKKGTKAQVAENIRKADVQEGANVQKKRFAAGRLTAPYSKGEAPTALKTTKRPVKRSVAKAYQGTVAPSAFKHLTTMRPLKGKAAVREQIRKRQSAVKQSLPLPKLRAQSKG